MVRHARRQSCPRVEAATQLTSTEPVERLPARRRVGVQAIVDKKLTCQRRIGGAASLDVLPAEPAAQPHAHALVSRRRHREVRRRVDVATSLEQQDPQSALGELLGRPASGRARADDDRVEDLLSQSPLDTSPAVSPRADFTICAVRVGAAPSGPDARSIAQLGAARTASWELRARLRRLLPLLLVLLPLPLPLALLLAPAVLMLPRLADLALRNPQERGEAPHANGGEKSQGTASRWGRGQDLCERVKRIVVHRFPCVLRQRRGAESSSGDRHTHPRQRGTVLRSTRLALEAHRT